MIIAAIIWYAVGALSFFLYLRDEGDDYTVGDFIAIFVAGGIGGPVSLMMYLLCSGVFDKVVVKNKKRGTNK